MRTQGRERSKRKNSMDTTRIKECIIEVLEDIPDYLLHGKAFKEKPYVLFTEADLQAVIYNELMESLRLRALEGVLTSPVHMEYPPRMTRKYVDRKGAIRDDIPGGLRRSHDLAIIDVDAANDMDKDLFNNNHYYLFPLLCCVELKHKWKVTLGVVKNSFSYDIDSIQHTFSYEPFMRCGFAVLVNVGQSLPTEQVSELRLAFSPLANKEKPIYCLYIEIPDPHDEGNDKDYASTYWLHHERGKRA